VAFCHDGPAECCRANIMSDDRVIRHIAVRGRVQGVGFRAFVEDRSVSLGVEGWVRNRRDGSVEAVFAGPIAAVEAVIESCRAGPRHARVDALDQREGTAAELDSRGVAFACLPTA
jgi:acylphosphatase